MLERVRIIKVGRVPTKRNDIPVAALLSGALVWGLIWYPYRVLQEAGISGALATALTFGFAMLWGIFILPRLWRERATLDKWTAWLVLSVGWANLGYVLGMLHGEVMRVLLLFYLAPVWTILFSRWLLKEHLNRYGYAIVLLSLAGAVFMLWTPELGLPYPQNISEWLGLSAGISFALSNVVSRFSFHLSVEVKSFSVLFGTIALTLPFLWWQGGTLQQLGNFSAGSWGLLLLMGGVLFATSQIVQYGVTHLPANRAVVLFLFELVVAAFSSWWLTDEVMDLHEWAGAALIVSATLLSSRMYRFETNNR